MTARFHRERPLMLERQRFDRGRERVEPLSYWYEFHFRGSGDPKRVERKTAVGRYRKRKPLDCGTTRCPVCSIGKFPRELTPGEVRARDRERQDRAELS